MGHDDDAESALSELRGKTQRKPGRKPSHDQKDLLHRRDQLIDFLELNWPELKPEFKKAGDPAYLDKILQIYQTQGYQPHAAGHLLVHSADLWAFLQSGRFHGDPRQIANAMAGVPKISWRRSFDICNSKPSRLAIHLRALLDYLERRFHDRFLKLKEAHAKEEVRAILKGVRTDDHYMLAIREHPERFSEIRQAAEWRSPIAGILFLSESNAARTQMAEGLARKLFVEAIHLQSAGLKPRPVHPLALKVLKEVGIDTSRLRSKAVDAIDAGMINVVITIGTREVRPPASLRKALVLSWPIGDLAVEKGSQAERLQRFREAREEISRGVDFLHREITQLKRLIPRQ